MNHLWFVVSFVNLQFIIAHVNFEKNNQNILKMEPIPLLRQKRQLYDDQVHGVLRRYVEQVEPVYIQERTAIVNVPGNAETVSRPYAPNDGTTILVNVQETSGNPYPYQTGTGYGQYGR